MKKKTNTFLILIFAAVILLASCQKPEVTPPVLSPEPTHTPLPSIEKVTEDSIAFLFLDSNQENYELLYHQLAYLRMESKGYNVNNVYVNPNQDLTGIFSQLELEGVQYAIVTSDKLSEQVENYTNNNTSNIAFLQHAERYMDNAVSYQIKLYEYYYLAGAALCSESSSNVAGFVAIYPNEQTIRCINAFALGMKSVDESAVVVVSWIDNAEDEGGIAQVVESLMIQKCDVFGYFIPGDLVEKISDNLGAHYMTMSTHTVLDNKSKLAIKPAINLDKYFAYALNTDKSSLMYEFRYLGVKDEVIGYEISNSISDASKQTVKEAYENIQSGYQVFSGPIYNDIGLIVPEGTILPDADVLDMLWFVDNVVGELPAG